MRKTCQWKHEESGVVCLQCGGRLTAPVVKRCPSWVPQEPKSEPPSTGRRIARYAAAWTRWALRWMPTRDENQIHEILAICVKCDQYDAQGEACNACGCCTNKRTQGWANKIAMATEHCPLKKW